MAQPLNANSLIEMFREIVRADESYFRMITRQMDREQIMPMARNYMQMRESMFGLIETLVAPPEPTTPPVTMTFQMPLNWNDPIPVVATPAQIRHSMINQAVSEPPQSCAICQDSIHEHGVELRNCQHAFHRSCITTWFTTSVRCPVCRNDIRETDED